MAWIRRCVVALAVLLASAAALDAALPKPQLAPEAASLTGHLLVAAPAMSDPRFRSAVILLVRHAPSGTFGIVVNRPIEERPIAELVEKSGDLDPVDGKIQIYAGGPVQTNVGFVLHTSDYKRPETIGINGEAALTASAAVLRDIARKQGPQKALVALGYAGWGPSQLEAEMAQDVWFTLPFDPALVFDERRDRVWDEAMARRPP